MIALYARVSTAEQATEGYSIDEQVERLKKYCYAIGRKDFKVYIDAGRTGANIDREGMQEIIKDARAGKIDKVIVYKLDRLSRSQKDTLYLIEDVFLAHGVDFESITERFDTSTSFGRAMLGILAVFAQLEREQIKERMAMGKEGRAKQGKWHGGGHIPIGYDYADGELVVNQFEALQIKEIFERYINGDTIGNLESDLNSRGITHKYGIWARDRIARTLKNNVYIGVIKSNGAEHVGTHEAIISRDQFEAAQKRLAMRSTRRESRTPNYLGGLLYCKQCGARYGATTLRTVGSKQYRYYSCYSRHKVSIRMVKNPDCKNKTWRTDILDELVFGEMRRLSLEPDKIHALIEKEAKKRQDDSHVGDILRQEREKLESQRGRLLNLYMSGSFTPQELDERVFALNRQIESIDGELKAIDDKKPEIEPQQAVAALSGFDDILKLGDYNDIRNIIDMLIKKIEIDGEDVYIYWRFT